MRALLIDAPRPIFDWNHHVFITDFIKLGLFYLIRGGMLEYMLSIPRHSFEQT
jgi:hypothetical protein